MSEQKRDTRCLECAHEFPEETLKIGERGFVQCPKCSSENVERIITGYNYDTTKVTHKEGYGHD